MHATHTYVNTIEQARELSDARESPRWERKKKSCVPSEYGELSDVRDKVARGGKITSIVKEEERYNDVSAAYVSKPYVSPRGIGRSESSIVTHLSSRPDRA